MVYSLICYGLSVVYVLLANMLPASGVEVGLIPCRLGKAGMRTGGYPGMLIFAGAGNSGFEISLRASKLAGLLYRNS